MSDCIFCKIIRGEIKSCKVYENDSVYAFLDTHPANKYHTLVIPKKHYENIFDIPDDELKRVSSVAKNIAVLYKEKLGINNIQLINSSGIEAQQDIFHFHLHIVPRKNGDTQDVKWQTHPEWVSEFDDLLKKLN